MQKFIVFLFSSLTTVGRDYVERENVRLTFSANDTITFVTILVVDGAEFRDDVTVFGVLSTGGEEGVSVGPDALVTIIEDERTRRLLVYTTCIQYKSYAYITSNKIITRKSCS